MAKGEVWSFDSQSNISFNFQEMVSTIHELFAPVRPVITCGYFWEVSKRLLEFQVRYVVHFDIWLRDLARGGLYLFTDICLSSINIEK